MQLEGFRDKEERLRKSVKERCLEKHRDRLNQVMWNLTERVFITPYDEIRAPSRYLFSYNKVTKEVKLLVLKESLDYKQQTVYQYKKIMNENQNCVLYRSGVAFERMTENRDIMYYNLSEMYQVAMRVFDDWTPREIELEIAEIGYILRCDGTIGDVCELREIINSTLYKRWEKVIEAKYGEV